jgi:hypothetical protein
MESPQHGLGHRSSDETPRWMLPGIGKLALAVLITQLNQAQYARLTQSRAGQAGAQRDTCFTSDNNSWRGSTLT